MRVVNFGKKVRKFDERTLSTASTSRIKHVLLRTVTVRAYAVRVSDWLVFCASRNILIERHKSREY